MMHFLYGVIGMPLLFSKNGGQCISFSFNMVACYFSSLLGGRVSSGEYYRKISAHGEDICEENLENLQKYHHG